MVDGFKPVDVLLVEDNMDEAKLAIRELNKHNLANNLLHVTDGEQALEYIFGEGEWNGRNVSNRPKLVLLDLKMPKVDGMEVLRKIRGDERTKSIPVVVLTSSQEEKDIAEANDLIVNSYIVKPIDFHNFAESIKEIGFYWLLMNKTK